MTNAIRVRYAPSPTGHLHIGNARTALFNYLFARRHNGAFIIRIEDTDIKRNVQGGEENQLQYLKWLGIDWEESIDVGGEFGPYRQTERLDIYKTYWQQLIDQGNAYLCFCTEEELEQEREEQAARGETPRYSGAHRNLSDEQRAAFEAEGRVPSVRFRVPEGRTLTFHDLVKGEISFESDGMGDYVIVKKDGIPTYNFAVVIDDYLMKISHVLRGEDHISNTPRQLLIYEALNWQAPIFGHMTLIVNEQRKKLSKRDESIIQFIEQYDHLGYLPEALFNFIALLGWSPEGENEMFLREELIEAFNEERLSRSPAVFDTEKLKWMNNYYIKKADVGRITELAIPHLQQAGRIPAELDDSLRQWVTSLVGLYQEQLHFASEIVELSEMFFTDRVTRDEESEAILKEEQVPVVLNAFLKQIEPFADSELTAETIQQSLKQVQKDTGFKGKALFMPIRVALTGQMHGRDLNQTLYLLGKAKIVDRLSGILS
ncbi:MAG: glutamyl-tRNA synthetase [Paenibacillus sp.]|jgi:nondiscriminating glutamyl-tRNA synthetase|nr:glutamyl-tRNA synthetase [Paenibacillus sp.]